MVLSLSACGPSVAYPPSTTYKGYRAMAVLRAIDPSIVFVATEMQAVTNSTLLHQEYPSHDLPTKGFHLTSIIQDVNISFLQRTFIIRITMYRYSHLHAHGCVA